MTKHFEGFADDSRVWVFQADKTLSPEDKNYICIQLAAFLKQWNSHKVALHSAFEILYDYFIVVALKDTPATSGCSIDALTQEVKKIGNVLQVDFLKNGNVAVLDGDVISIIPFNAIRQLVSENKILPGSFVFNKQVTNVIELNHQWLLPVTTSWMAKYFVPKVQNC